MPEQNPIATEVDRINVDVTGVVAGDKLPQETAAGLAAQSMAHSLAIVTADAAASLRNVETMMSTVQAVALTRWIEAGGREDDSSYQVIVRAAGQVTAEAVGLWREINVFAQQLLRSLSNEPEQGQAIVVEAVSAAPTQPSKTASKKKASKKKASKKKASKKKPAKKSGKKAAKKRPAAAKPAPAPRPVPDAAASNE